MNKISTILLFLLITHLYGYAQNSVVTNAILYERDGDIENAKKQIDLAIVHEKTKSVSKTWYYKGLIYSDIYKSDKVEVKQLTQDALKTSTEALLKSKELDPAKGEYYKLSDQLLQENWANLINRGIAYYQGGKYEDAIQMYELAQAINPADTTAYVYGTYSAEGLKKNDLIQKYTDKLLEIKYKGLYIYTIAVRTALLDKNYNKAIEISKKGLTDYPLNSTLLEFQTLSYIEGSKAEEGLTNINDQLKTKPYEVNLLISQAVLYTSLNNNDKAMEAYQKIIAIEPHNFFANYNSAVINFDKGRLLAQKGDKTGSQTLFSKALENAKRAKSLATDESDLANLDKLITELNTILK